MVNLIVGLKGSGKTKRLISLVEQASKEAAGDVVCIEKTTALRFDIPYSVRLVTTDDYDFGSYTYLKGFISGMHAGNYDITHIFIDNLYKVLESHTAEESDEFILWCEKLGEKENITFTITMSEDPENTSEVIKKFII